MELEKVNSSFHLDEDIWSNLPDIVTVLAVFADKTDELQKGDLTLCDSYGIWIALTVRLKNLSRIPLAIVLLERVETRLKVLMADTVLIAAIYLDPRYRLVLDETQKKIAVQHLTNLHHRLTDNADINHSDDNLNIEDSEDAEMNEVDKYLNELEVINRGGISLDFCSTSDNFQKELVNFSKMDRIKCANKIVPFWASIRFDYPLLYEVAKTVLAVPPTEAKIERNFSHLDFILNKRRNRLTDQALENILFLRLNGNLFSEAFETFCTQGSMIGN